jgi:hypothetical protein
MGQPLAKGRQIRHAETVLSNSTFKNAPQRTDGTNVHHAASPLPSAGLPSSFSRGKLGFMRGESGGSA